MNRVRLEVKNNKFRSTTIKFAQAAALAFVLVIALPAKAGDDRAIKSRVSPVYPEIAKRMHIGGSVKLEATVDAQGKVTEVKAVSGNRMLSVAAEDAVRQWRFVPGSSDSNVSVEVNFAANLSKFFSMRAQSSGPACPPPQFAFIICGEFSRPRLRRPKPFRISELEALKTKSHATLILQA